MAILVLSVVSVSSVRGQSIVMDHLRGGWPSPTAASLGKYGHTPVSLATGTPDITIPLAVVEGQHVSVPIRLRYHASGIPVEEVPSWVGLGWALEAGGVITRSLRGIPDENTDPDKKGYFSSYTFGPQGIYDSFRNFGSDCTGAATGNFIDAVSEGRQDGEPDLFTFNFGGRSGAFLGGRDEFEGGTPAPLQFRASPYQNLQIGMETTASASLGYRNDRYISRWTIRTEDGTTYVFDTTEFTTTAEYSPDSYDTKYASAWHLTEIRSADGADVITLEYADFYDEIEHRDRREWDYMLAAGVCDDYGDPPGGDLIHRTSFINGKRLERITSSHHIAEFTTAAISGDENPMQRLASIELKATPSQAVIRSFVFSHSGGLEDQRLFLSSLHEENAAGVPLPGYSFFYNGTPLPDRLSFAVDHWGYYNGKTSNDNKAHAPLPADLITWYELFGNYNSQWELDVDGADREPDPDYIQAGILTSITYPTGGWNHFFYEPNDYYMVRGTRLGSAGNKLTGGVRIKTIESSDAMGGPSSFVDYGYTYTAPMLVEEYTEQFILPYLIWEHRYELQGKSTGVVAFEPQYKYFHNPTSGCPFLSISDQSLLPIHSPSNLTYQAVTVTQREDEFGEPSGFPKEVHVFSTANGFLAEGDLVGIEYADSCLPNGAPYSGWNEYMGWSAFAVTRYDWTRGLPQLQAQFRGDTLAARSLHGYSTNFGQIDERTKRYPAVQIKRVFNAVSLEWTELARYYENISTYQYRNLGRTYECQAGDCEEIWSESFVHNVDLPPFQLRSVRRSKSDGSSRTTEYVYAHEKYPLMADSNRVSQVYATTSKDGTVVKAKVWTTWDNNWGSGNGYWRPKETWEWVSGTPPADPSGATSEKTATFDSYDSRGNLLLLTDARGTAGAILWEQDDSRPHRVTFDAYMSETFTDGFDHYQSLSEFDSGGWDGSTGSDFVSLAAEPGAVRFKTTSTSKSVYRELPYPLWGSRVVELDVMPEGGSDHFVYVRGATIPVWVGTLQFTAAGGIRVRDNTTYVAIGSYSGQGWIHVRMEMEATEYHVVIDGTRFGPFQTEATGFQPMQLRFQDEGGGGGLFVDNLRVYPPNAGVWTLDYDPDTGRPTTTTDHSGLTQQFLYDEHGRFRGTIAGGDRPLSSVAYSHSRDRHSSFSSSDPNLIHQSVAGGDVGRYESFGSVSDWTSKDQSNGSTSTWAASGGELIHTNTGGASSWVSDLFSMDLGEELTGRVVIELSVKPDLENTGWNFGIAAGGSAWGVWNGGSENAIWTAFTPALEWQTYTHWLSPTWATVFDGFDDDRYYRVKIVADTEADEAEYYVDGKLYLAGRGFRFSTSGIQKVALVNYGFGSATEWHVRDLLVYEEGSQSTAFYDGLGRERQIHSGADTPIVAAMEFDEVGRLIREWLPYSAPAFGFDSNFAQNAASEYLGKTGGDRPYRETHYEADPRALVSYILPPGVSAISESIRQGHGIETVAGVDVTMTESVDEDGMASRVFVDGFSNEILRTTALDSTWFTYDALGRLEEVRSPEGRTARYRYDGRGRLVGKSTPDADGNGNGVPTDEQGVAGSEDFVYRYDRGGNLRYVEDPVRRGPSQDKFIYYDYNPWGQVVESGVYSGGTDFTQADPNEPRPAGTTAEVSTFTYAGSFMTSVDFEGGSYAYQYDKLGRASGLEVALDGLGDKKLTYEYDVGGRLVKRSFQDGVTGESFYQWYTYDTLGRLIRVTSHMEDDESQSAIDAEYDYTPASQVEQLTLGGTTQSVDFEYTIRGWLSRINDVGSPGNDLFSMSLGYDQLAEIGAAQNATPRRNGNVSWAAWSTAESVTPAAVVGYTFAYDSKNRLSSADFGFKSGSWQPSSAYDVGTSGGISYDGDGNILSLLRRDGGGVGTATAYAYAQQGSNRLTSVSGGYSSSYTYDPSGNVTSDAGRGLSGISYDHRNLPVSLTIGGATYTYRYDADGNRVSKSRTGGGDTAYYVRGLGGETLAVYDGCGQLLYWNILAGGEVIGKALPDTQPDSCAQ
jgi:YD repeat-containing protein